MKDPGIMERAARAFEALACCVAAQLEAEALHVHAPGCGLRLPNVYYDACIIADRMIAGRLMYWRWVDAGCPGQENIN